VSDLHVLGGYRPMGRFQGWPVTAPMVRLLGALIVSPILIVGSNLGA
jgi:hypothetical protein